jgi:hypothetical protein
VLFWTYVLLVWSFVMMLGDGPMYSSCLLVVVCSLFYGFAYIF